VTPDGIIDLEALGLALASHDKAEGLPLVAVHAANNETGVIQPIAEIASDREGSRRSPGGGCSAGRRAHSARYRQRLMRTT
jgi:hypothetical protein